MLAEPVKPGQTIRAEGFRAGGGNLGILQMAAVACGQLCAASICDQIAVAVLGYISFIKAGPTLF